MPFYDYVCEKCGHQMEVMHSVHGHGPSVCPECGGPMKKAISAPAVHFKGSGWARKERTGKAVKPAEGKSEATGSSSSGGSAGSASTSGDSKAN